MSGHVSRRRRHNLVDDVVCGCDKHISILFYWCRLGVATLLGLSTFSVIGSIAIEEMTSAVTSSSSTASPEKLLIGYLPALTGNKGRSKHFDGAFIYALKDINARLKSSGSKYQLDYILNDSKGDTTESVRGMTSQYLKDALAFIGPETTCAIEARVAAAWNLPMIAFQCRDSTVSNPEHNYPTFARTIPSMYKVFQSVIALLKQFKWTQFTPVAASNTKWQDATGTLKALADQNHLVMHEPVHFSEPIHVDLERMRKPLEDTFRKTRIYVFMGDNEALIDFLRQMQQMELNNGEYMVIAVHEAPFDPKHRYFNRYLETLTENMIDAFRPVLMVMPRGPSNKNYSQFIEETRNYSYQAPFNAPMPPIPNIKETVPIYAAYLYDAVNVYARALFEAIDDGVDIKNGTAIVNRIKGRTYESIQGHTLYIDENGDAEAINYTVLALVTNSQTGNRSHPGPHRILKPVGYFHTAMNQHEPEFQYEGGIEWIGKFPPVSEPACGFNGSKCPPLPTWSIAVAGLTAFGLITVVFFSYRHYKYEQKLSSLFWKIDYKDLVMADLDSIDPTLSDKLKHRTLGRLSYLSSGDSTRDSSSQLEQTAFTKVASFRGCLVAVKLLRNRHVEVNRAVQKELCMMKELTHDNVNRFIGACLEPPTRVCIVCAYCSRGSLKDILQNKDLHLDGILVASLVFDLIKGMIYLHESEIISHGYLKTSNCLVDSRWVLQVADFGLHGLKVGSGRSATESDVETYCIRNLWRAPELLRDPDALPRGSQKGDIYSFGLILYEIQSRTSPYWADTGNTPQEMLWKIRDCDSVTGEIWRPDVTEIKCEDFVVRCMQECWQEDPDLRPDFKYTRVRLKSMQKGMRSNIFDNMLAIMEKYANTLESLVDERTMQLAEEKKKTEALLLRMLPRSVAEQLISGKPVVPELYDKVTIYFSDIVGFTSMSANSTPMQVVNVLNDLYTLFDSIIESYDVYKVETIGDAYMVVSGLPIRNGDNHAGEIASLSLHLLHGIRDFRIQHRPSETLKLRVGIHTGPVVAGVVGLKMPRYCLFGDTVNTASRMESSGLALRIHCSKDTKEMLDKVGGYVVEPRGIITVKGKGDMFTYFLVGEDSSRRQQRLNLAANDTNLIPASCTADEQSNSHDTISKLHKSCCRSLESSRASDVTCAAENTCLAASTSSSSMMFKRDNQQNLIELIFPKSAQTMNSTTSAGVSSSALKDGSDPVLGSGRPTYVGSTEAIEVCTAFSSSLQDCSVYESGEGCSLKVRAESAGGPFQVKDFRIPKSLRYGRVLVPESGSDGEIGGHACSGVVTDNSWRLQGKCQDEVPCAVKQDVKRSLISNRSITSWLLTLGITSVTEVTASQNQPLEKKN